MRWHSFTVKRIGTRRKLERHQRNDVIPVNQSAFSERVKLDQREKRDQIGRPDSNGSVEAY